MRSPSFQSEVLSYAAIGVLNTGIGLATILLLKLVAGVDLIIANAVGYMVGLAISFWGNRYWTFAAQPGAKLRKIPAFLVVVGFAFIANIAVIKFLLSFSVVYSIAQLAGVLVYSAFGFVGMKYFVFRD